MRKEELQLTGKNEESEKMKVEPENRMIRRYLQRPLGSLCSFFVF
jgi:hypothetical protein